ncbi:endonuclease [Escherichia phage vB_Eco_Mak]|nr:endonuclease [Escherichia phage vB_Eco_Mak]CAH7774592.1 homingendonuclease[Caudoviralessp.] [Escherichia phage vB_Eco_Titus]
MAARKTPVVRPLRFHTHPNGCITCVSHKANHDGYFRYKVGSSRNGTAKMFMFHRFVWEHKHGEIPEGYTINHKCKNRGCQNVDHMELLSVTEHAAETNRNRYRKIKHPLLE